MYDYSEPLIFDEYDLKIALDFQKRSGDCNNQKSVMNLQRSWIKEFFFLLSNILLRSLFFFSASSFHL